MKNKYDMPCYFAFALCAVLLSGLFLSHSAHGAPQDMNALPTCEIRGTISEVKIKKSAVPSLLVENETLITVDVQERKARSGNAPCKEQKIAAEKRTYKLCSQDQVRAGDTVDGTEALSTDPTATTPAGCLFDLVVVTQKN